MNTLFQESDFEPIKRTKPKTTCRNCKFRYKHEYGKMFYCSKQTDKKTSYGDKKIKASNAACHLYESNK